MKHQAIACVALFTIYVALLGECKTGLRGYDRRSSKDCGQYSVAPKPGPSYDARPGEFPSFVEVRVPVVDLKTLESRTVSCGGSIIGGGVLAGVHCFVHEGKIYDKARVVIFPGSAKSAETKSSLVCLTNEYMSKRNDSPTGDFALIRLWPFHPRANLTLACEPDSKFDFGSVSQYYALGFRKQQFSNSTSTRVTPVRRVPCPSIDNSKYFCVVENSPCSDSTNCLPDSGSVVYFINPEDKRLYIAGIAAQGVYIHDYCSYGISPTVYLDIQDIKGELSLRMLQTCISLKWDDWDDK